METSTPPRLLTDVSTEDLPTLPYCRESATTLPREERYIAIKRNNFPIEGKQARLLLGDTALHVLGLV